MTSPSKVVNTLCSKSAQYNHIKAVSQEEQFYGVSTGQIIVASFRSRSLTMGSIRSDGD